MIFWQFFTSKGFITCKFKEKKFYSSNKKIWKFSLNEIFLHFWHASNTWLKSSWDQESEEIGASKKKVILLQSNFSSLLPRHSFWKVWDHIYGWENPKTKMHKICLWHFLTFWIRTFFKIKTKSLSQEVKIVQISQKQKLNKGSALVIFEFFFFFFFSDFET